MCVRTYEGSRACPRSTSPRRERVHEIRTSRHVGRAVIHESRLVSTLAVYLYITTGRDISPHVALAASLQRRDARRDTIFSSIIFPLIPKERIRARITVDTVSGTIRAGGRKVARPDVYARRKRNFARCEDFRN